jgi:beta-lactamase regulating signal transducer with metallopeptidase domain
MIAAWMTYALVIAMLVSVAALMAERIAILRQLPTRWAWVVALLLSILLPVLFAAHSARSSAEATTAIAALAAQERPPLYAQSPIAWIGGDAATAARRVSIDTWLLAAWSAMSAFVLAALAMGWIQLRRRLRSAIDGQVQGVSITVTRDVGPAVVGIVRPRIVVPRWLLQQDPATQAITIAHEQEHLRAQDIRVLGGALLIAVLIPWNLPIWWQLRRLRFALEVDCDARVLRTGQSRSTYSAVLLSVATHLVPLRAAAAGLSESGSSLEKRIRIMHAPLRRGWRLLAAVLGSCSIASIVVAANVTAPPVAALAAETSDGGLPRLSTPMAQQTGDEMMLARVVAHFHPQLLERLQDGRPYVWVIANERGQVSQTALDVRPSWDSQEEFTRKLTDYLQNAGIQEEQLRGLRVMQIPIGPNYAVLMWAVAPGAAAQDPDGPAYQPGPVSAEATQAHLLARVTAERRLIEHFAPDALAAGVPDGEELWFLMDPDGKVLHAGRRSTISDPEKARRAMKELFPQLSVGYVTRGTAVKDTTGKRVPVSWQWLERQ